MTENKQNKQAPGYYRTKVGDITVTSILDGGMQFPNEIFINATPDIIKDSRDRHFVPQDGPYPAYINSFLVETGGKKILVDTGARNYVPTAGQTTDVLKMVGVSPSDIDEIILTHVHPDHTGGLLDDAGKISFPKAVVKVCAPEIDFWFSDDQMAKFSDKKGLFDSARKNLTPYKTSGQLQTYNPDGDLGAGLSSVSLPGHTPGHSGVMVSDGAQQLLIWGDIVHNAFLQFDYPDQSLSFDTDPDAARKTRKRVFDLVATDRLRIAGMHLPMSAFGHLAKRGSGYDFVPQWWETNI